MGTLKFPYVLRISSLVNLSALRRLLTSSIVNVDSYLSFAVIVFPSGNQSIFSDYNPSQWCKKEERPREAWFCVLCFWQVQDWSSCWEHSSWPATTVSPCLHGAVCQESLQLWSCACILGVHIELLTSWKYLGTNCIWLALVLKLTFLDDSMPSQPKVVPMWTILFLHLFLWQSCLGEK